LKRTLARMAERWRDQPENLPLLRSLDEVVGLAGTLPFEVDLWQPQNVYCELAAIAFPEQCLRLEEGDKQAEGWLESFLNLGEKLGVRVAEMQQQLSDARSVPGAADLLRETLASRHVPRATYRFQMHKGFTFLDCLAQVGYLHELGVSDCYVSPILQARPGSGHGYDVVDHARLNEELGSPEEFDSLTGALREQGMGLIVDVVPNHMGIGRFNAWWNDVLENGPSSIYANFFDITWNPANRNLENKVLLPLLEDQYGEVLEHGKIHLVHEAGSFALYYYDHRLPISPCTYAMILEHPLLTLVEELGEDSEPVRQLRSILTALNYLPPRTDTDPEKIKERNREKEVIKERISQLVKSSEEVGRAIDEAVRMYNGRPGTPSSFDRLDQLIDAQAYRPAFWRVATEEINYRRFFDINELAAIKVERPEVFEATHRLYLRLLAEGKASGLRVDHPDGLWDPHSYFRQVQEEYVIAHVRQRLHPRPLPPTLEEELRARLGYQLDGASPPPLYVTAEKILTPGEELPRDWAVDGTTGYDFLNLVNGLFVDQNAEEIFEEIHASFVGEPVRFSDLVNEAKKMIMLVSLASEINGLSQLLDRISERNRRYRDFTLISLTYVTREILACLPVYRTYVTSPESVSPRDRAFIEQAGDQAK
jgi:(1->4)-alpha-D-glucan 1-alpha-D-glucosylmutase